MAHLPSQHPDLALHLTDRALNPLITSSRAQKQLGALTALSHTALSAHESALRLSLGAPQRIMVEHDEGGPVFLQTFLSPHATTTTTTTTTTATTSTSGFSHRKPPSASGPNPTGPQPPTSPSSSALDLNGTSSSQIVRSTPSQNPRRQHQGALALAVENRNAAAAATTTTAYLRSGVYPNNDDDDEEEEEEEEEEEGRGHSMFLGNDAESEDEDEDPNTPAMLLGIVVAASSDDTLEARRAAARLERVGREIQGWWSELQSQDPAPRAQHPRTDEEQQQQQQRQGDAAVG